MKDYMRKPAHVNPEFARAMPITGFGEIESTVLASLSSSCGAPVPRLTTPKPERKVCRIFSPVATTTHEKKLFGDHVSPISNGDASGGHPLVADNPLFRSPEKPDATGANAEPTLLAKHCRASPVCPKLLESRRPMTSDLPTRTSQRYRKDIGIHSSVRPSTSSGQELRRRKKDILRQDDRTAAVDKTKVLSATWNAEGGDADPPARESEKSQGACRRDRRDSSRCSGSGRRGFPEMGRKKGDDLLQPPLNQFWPSAGGPKAFLRPFIERNRNHLWVYDPSLASMNHMEAYRYFVDKGNFEGMKRMLVRKEDALIKGTGSLQMANIINRHRGATPGRHTQDLGSLPSASIQSAEEPNCRESQRLWLHRARSGANTPAAVEDDPFQRSGTNSDKLRREESRRQDLLMHARKLDNTFYRRRSYQPGDFLKHRPRTAPTVGASGGEEYRTGSRRSSLCVTDASQRSRSNIKPTA